MNEIYLILLTSFSTMAGMRFVNYITKKRQYKKYKEWEQEDICDAEKNFIQTITGFDDIIENEGYSKEIKLLAQRMKSFFENNFKQIKRECSSWDNEYNCGKRHSVNFYFEHAASFLQGNIEEIFLEYTINLTPREKEIIDDLIKKRSIYLSHEEKQWLHAKCKEIHETK